MNDDHRALWRRIDEFAIDDPASATPFSVRLARENGWSLRHAQRVIAEYRRFLFLAATASSPACPSEAVDEAWHLHLCYTRSYWNDLCRDVLGQPLHHEPTQGGRDQLHLHRAMYEQALVAYRAAFDREPPRDIWPGADERFAAPAQVRVDRATHWIVPRPLVTFARALRRTGGTLSRATGVVALAALPVLGLTNPLDLTGPEFLALFITLLAIGVLGGIVLRRVLRSSDDFAPFPQLDPYEAAVLSGGEDRPVRARGRWLRVREHRRKPVALRGEAGLRQPPSGRAGRASRRDRARRCVAQRRLQRRTTCRSEGRRPVAGSRAARNGGVGRRRAVGAGRRDDRHPDSRHHEVHRRHRPRQAGRVSRSALPCDNRRDLLLRLANQTHAARRALIGATSRRTFAA